MEDFIELRNRFFTILCNQHNYILSQQPEITDQPYLKKEGVEIHAVPDNIGIFVNVFVPLPIRKDKLFEKFYFCSPRGSRRYGLISRKQFCLQHEKDLEKVIKEVTAIAKHGESLLFFN
jgi:hypothetical protein